MPSVAKLTFVVGKGGVGKTTVACALALRLAARRPRESILLMSTDPAHSLGDMLQTPLKSRPARIAEGKGRLFAWQVDGEREWRKFLATYREGILNIAEQGTFFSREELAPLLETALPGMAEVAGLLALRELLEKNAHDHIVVDTAPFGHTLRLFELPLHFRKFLHFLQVASSRDALLSERFGGRVSSPAQEFLRRWEAMAEQMTSIFASRQAEICLVTSVETFSLHEASRSLQALGRSVPGMNVGAIVLNRVVVEPGGCSHCRRRARMAKQAGQYLRRRFPRIPRLTGPDPGNPILGIDRLRRFGLAVFDKRSVSLRHPAPSPSQGPRLEKSAWPLVDAPLSFTMGKGGVGKTTATAALAFHARKGQPRIPVLVCSTDPAPSLDDVFQMPVGNRRVSVLGDAKLGALEIDSVAEFRAWIARIQAHLSEPDMQSGGLRVDLTFEKEVFAALLDIVPPGVDELFAIFRILHLLHPGSRKPTGRIFIDMAPTGHALELLRMPNRILLWSRLLLKTLAAHRSLALAQDVAVELASLGQQVRKLIDIMQDHAQSRAWVVMLPEAAPDLQTRRLLDAVDRIGIKVDSLFVNRVLQDAGECGRCRRAQDWQLAILGGMKTKYRRRAYVVPEFPTEIAGAEALEKFTRELWRIAD